MDDLAGQLLLRVRNRAQIVILCGRNKTLLRELRERFVSDRNVACLPFTEKVAQYMDACDVLFTKPGGLTTSEAAAKNLLLIHTAPIPGCETKNAEFFSSRGMSALGATVAQEAALAVELMENPEKRQTMLRAQQKYFHTDAAQKICNLLQSKVKA